MRIIISFLSFLCLSFAFSISFLISGSLTAHAAPSPEDFGTLARIQDAAISPDGTQVALMINNKGTYGVQIIRLGETATKPRVIMLSKNTKPGWVKWVNNDRVLIMVWASDKVNNVPLETAGIFNLDTVTMKGRHLVKPPHGVFRQFNHHVVDFLQDDPDHILMKFSDTDVFSPDVQKVNVTKGRYSKIQKGRPTIQDWYTDRRGDVRVGQGISDKSKKEEKWTLTIRDTDGKKWRDASEYPGLKKNSRIFGFTSDPNELIVGLYQGKDTLGLYIYDLSQRKISRKLFHNDEFDVSGLILDAEGDEVIGAKFVSETSETQLFDDNDTSLQRMRKFFEGYTVNYIDQSRNGEKILFSVSNAYDPGSIMMLRAGEDKPSRIGDLRPELDMDDMGMVISVKYKARDGFKIPAYVTLPPTVNDGADIRSLPFIILPHGGPYARDANYFDYFAQFFATRGYGVLQMNFRGSVGYGKAYEEAGRKNWVLMQDDVEDGANWLIEKGYADPERMCIAGWSYGGYAALMGGVRNPDLYKCVISIAGVTNLNDIVSDMKKYRFGRLAANNTILQGFDGRSDMKENSPVKRADEIRAPIFLAHGTYDQQVHIDQFRSMKRALKKHNVPVTALEFKQEDHSFSRQKSRQEMLSGIDDFLVKTMGVSEYMKP